MADKGNYRPGSRVITPPPPPPPPEFPYEERTAGFPPLLNGFPD